MGGWVCVSKVGEPRSQLEIATAGFHCMLTHFPGSHLGEFHDDVLRHAGTEVITLFLFTKILKEKDGKDIARAC